MSKAGDELWERLTGGLVHPQAEPIDEEFWLGGHRVPYVVTFMGYVSGSYGGRDDGQIEKKVVMVDDLADAAQYAGQTDAKLYSLTEIGFGNAVDAANKRKASEEYSKAELTKQQELALLDHLKKKYPGS